MQGFTNLYIVRGRNYWHDTSIQLLNSDLERSHRLYLINSFIKIVLCVLLNRITISNKSQNYK